MTGVYYFISDLHVGGDEQLEQVDFFDELLAFLQDLEESDEDAELIINGDAFGLWEFTEVKGPGKFDALLDRYPELFEQFEVTGREIPITLIPGNHDYELAAYPEYVERLAEYNVTLEQEVSIERTVGDSVVHVEHGMQEDPNNRIPDFGNPYANPPGYFVNRQITSRAGQPSDRGKYNWLKDIQAVTPMTEIPEWLVSNYFYREMSSWLRFSVVPFFLLFNIGVLYGAIFALDWFDVWSLPLTLVEELLGFFGPAGRLVELVLAGNLVVIVLILAISVPLAVFVLNVRKTLRRFGLVRPSTEREPVEKYLDRARDVFASEPRVAVYVYGHTHRPSVTGIDERLVVNTGTWLKCLPRVDPLLGVLPPVYYAAYQLNYFRLSATDDGDVLVEHEVIEEPDPDNETLLQRLLTRSPRRRRELPEKTVVNGSRERGPQPDRSAVTE